MYSYLYNSQNVLFDWETLSLKSNAFLMALGMIRFEINAEGITTFNSPRHLVLDWTESNEGYLENSDISPSTVKFWFDELSGGRVPLSSIYPEDLLTGFSVSEVVDELNHEISKCHFAWAQGITFDCGILQWYNQELQSITEEEGQFRKYMDVRTTCKLAGLTQAGKKYCENYVSEVIYNGNHLKHDPVFDCWSSLAMLTVSLGRMGIIVPVLNGEVLITEFGD